MKYEDSELISVISDVLRNKKFGCLPTRHTINAHKKDDEPMQHKAVKLLSEITNDVSIAIAEMK